LAAGCTRNPYPLDQVSGTIRYPEGETIPFHRLVVTLTPLVDAVDAKTQARPAQVDVRPDGSFEVATTIRYGDGAIRGCHKVTIIALDKQEAPSKIILDKYASVETTPLEVDTRQAPWEIVVERPVD
jgi:hypothetical protein